MPASTARNEFIRDIAIAAVEGGIGYWASARRYRWSTGVAPLLDNMLQFPETRIEPAEDPEDFEPCAITRRTITAGLARIRAGGVDLHRDVRAAIVLADEDNDACQIDAYAADAIVQAGLFGELRFG